MALQAELQAVTNSKTMLEKELQEVITLTSTELEEYQEKVMELEDEVRHTIFLMGNYCLSFFYGFCFHSIHVYIFSTASRVTMLQEANPKVRRC